MFVGQADLAAQADINSTERLEVNVSDQTVSDEY